MTDELKAALARAEAAEEARDIYEKLATDLYHARAEAERQRDEAFTAGAEAMREACEKVATRHGYQQVADEIFALPIPAQEVK